MHERSSLIEPVDTCATKLLSSAFARIQRSHLVAYCKESQSSKFNPEGSTRYAHVLSELRNLNNLRVVLRTFDKYPLRSLQLQVSATSVSTADRNEIACSRLLASLLSCGPTCPPACQPADWLVGSLAVYHRTILPASHSARWLAFQQAGQLANRPPGQARASCRARQMVNWLESWLVSSPSQRASWPADWLANWLDGWRSWTANNSPNNKKDKRGY